MSRFEDRAGYGRIVTPRSFRRIIRPRGLVRFSPGFIFPGAAASSLDASYIGQGGDGGTSASSYSFASQNIGAAASDRYVFLNIQWFSTSGAPVLNSCSVAGIACTIVLQSNSVNNRPNNAIAYALVPSGTTGTIAFTFSATLSGTGHGMGFGVYRVQGPLNPTPVATRQNDDANIASLNTTIAVKKNGFMIWSVTHGSASFSMSAPTPNYNRQYGAGRNGCGAFGGGYAADGTQALTFSGSTSSAHVQDVAASFAAA
jgi:hypothetical protein